MNTDTASSNARAFTLTDLLVTLALLLALGIVLPLRAANKPASDRAICLNNLREIGRATILFAGDNNDSLPNVGWGTTEKSWLYSANPPSLVGSANLTAQMPYARASQLWAYHDKLEILRCPADRTNAGASFQLYLQRTIKISSYNMTGNGIVQGFTPQRPLKISQFQPNSIFFTEPDETSPFNFNDASINPSNLSEGASLRHVDVPLASLDGGVEVMNFTAYQKLRSAVTANRWYCYPLTANGRF
jgi:hypothetical protein